MNNYFTNITTHLKLKPTNIDAKANLESIIGTFKKHESVQRIKLENFHSKSSLKFNSVSKLQERHQERNLKFIFQKSYKKRWYSSLYLSFFLNVVVINLWWSNKSVSNVADFIKWIFFLIRIKSMQVGFIDL